MPQTNNGKIDYKALPAPVADVAEESTADDIAMPQTPAEKFLASVWEEVLEIEDVAQNDLFFDVGGHSLLVMKVIATVNEKTGIKLGPQDFLVATLEQMADKIEESHFFKSDEVESEAVAKTNPAPETVAETAGTTTQAESVPTKTAPASTNESDSQGVFKKLTGFWN